MSGPNPKHGQGSNMLEGLANGVQLSFSSNSEPSGGSSADEDLDDDE